MSQVIKSNQVRVEAAEPRPRRKRDCSERKAEPIRIDGRVRAIRFTCSCGDSSLIELEYDDEAPASSDAQSQ